MTLSSVQSRIVHFPVAEAPPPHVEGESGGGVAVAPGAASAVPLPDPKELMWRNREEHPSAAAPTVDNGMIPERGHMRDAMPYVVQG